MNKAKVLSKIGTHSGSFHCDEALACFMLRLTKKFSGAEIVRSRDPKVLETLPILVDVGAKYDPDNLRFDHHQRGFDVTFSPNHKIKLSSAGLTYKHFGKEILEGVTGLVDDDLEILYQKVYTDFIEGIDGIDNGVSQYDPSTQPKYKLRTDLSSRVGYLNPAWNEKAIDIDARFAQAMELAGSEFLRLVNFTAKSWFPARNIVKASLAKRHDYDPSGEVVVFTEYTLWQEHLFQLEDELKLSPPIKYALYMDSAGAWRVQCVPEAPGSFMSRKKLPAPWRGVRDEELSKLSGIPNCIFVHAAGFIGGNKTFDGAMEMAQKALKFSE